MHTPIGPTSGIETTSRARTVHLPAPIDQVHDRLREVLGKEGFSVLAEIDLSEILRRRLDVVALAPHRLLEVCRPDLARAALAVASDASLLLPCKIGLWAEGDGTTVAWLPPTRLLAALERPHLDEVTAQAEAHLARALEELARWRAPAARRRTAPAPLTLSLTEGERATAVEGLRRRVQALLVEAAGTEKRELQHDLAEQIGRLEAVITKLAGSAPS